mmetsp:Transcript_13909/g.33717  ORF Transcript_13909/g.33717 Transcript_13909/m.33717 type:complete len:211 (+) Transcript_13909:54-686(+)
MQTQHAQSDTPYKMANTQNIIVSIIGVHNNIIPWKNVLREPRVLAAQIGIQTERSTTSSILYSSLYFHPPGRCGRALVAKISRPSSLRCGMRIILRSSIRTSFSLLVDIIPADGVDAIHGIFFVIAVLFGMLMLVYLLLDFILDDVPDGHCRSDAHFAKIVRHLVNALPRRTPCHNLHPFLQKTRTLPNPLRNLLRPMNGPIVERGTIAQ